MCPLTVGRSSVQQVSAYSLPFVSSRLRSARWASLLALGLILFALSPPVRLRAKAAATMFEAVGRWVPRPFAHEPQPVASKMGGVAGRLFPGRPGDGGVLLVPGAAPAGIEDPRTNSLATALARSGRAVFVPDLELYEERFEVEDIERLVISLVGLAEITGRPVVAVGVSYGGSFALIAAADPRVDGHLSRVATFGAYFDLVGVIQAITTGASLVGDRVITWEAHPMARDFLYARTTLQLVPITEQSLFLDALAGKVDSSHLSPSSRAFFELLVNQDPQLTFQLAEALAPEYLVFLETFSPSAVADQIKVPVRALHSTDDPIVPYAELVRLGESMPDVDTTLVSIFEHVDFDPSSPGDWLAASPDLLRLWSFITWVLAG